MVWFVPVGIYEGVKTTAEITDPTVDLSEDPAEMTHVALRVGAGTIPLPVEYDELLAFLATSAPNDLYLPEWVGQTEDPEDTATKFEELAEHGIVMTFGEYPLDHPRMAGRVVLRGDEIARGTRSTAASSIAIRIDAGRGKVLVAEPLVTIAEALTDDPLPVEEMYARFVAALDGADREHASQLFEAGLQSLVQTGAVHVMKQE